MTGIRTFVAAAVIGCIGFSADVSEAALAKARGGSGHSGTLSSNLAIRKQQLICDPDFPTAGSTSVNYNPSIVTFDSVEFGPGYQGSVLIEIDFGEGTALIPLGQWLDGRPGQETGYLQTQFTEIPVITAGPITPLATHGQIAVPTSYTTVDEGGPAAIDTHAFLFQYLSGVGDTRIAEYTVFTAEGTADRGNEDDFFEGIDDQNQPFRVGPGQVAPVTVRGSLVAVPLPPAVLVGGIMLGGMAVVRRIRARRAGR